MSLRGEALRASMPVEFIIGVGLIVAVGLGFILLRGSGPNDPTAIKRRLKDHLGNMEKSRETDDRKEKSRETGDRRESLGEWLDSE